MLLVLFFALFLLGESLGSLYSNQYVDTVLHTALQGVMMREKLDPTFLANYTFEYKDKIFIGSVHGKAEYSEGTLYGLSQVERYSECDGPRNITGRTSINCTLSFKHLHTSYKGKVKYGVLPKVTIDAKADVGLTIVKVEFGKVPSESNARVWSFNFVTIGNLNTKFTGLGPLNKNMKVLEGNYRKQVSDELRNVLNNRFQYGLNLAAAQVPMPLR